MSGGAADPAASGWSPKALLARLGLPAVLRPLFGGRGAAFVLHRVRDPLAEGGFHASANRRNCLPPDRLAELLDALAADRVDVVGLDEAADRLAEDGRGRPGHRPRPFACLTFDDGYRDNHEALLPILRARRVPAAVFVAPGLLDGSAPLWWYALDEAAGRGPVLRLPLGGPDAPEADLPTGTPEAREAAFAAGARFFLSRPPSAWAPVLDSLAHRHGVDLAGLSERHMMTRTMLRDLAASSLVEVGAHTMTHPPLSQLGEAEARREMAESRAWLERETGRPVRHLAFPFGTPDAAGARESRLAAELGFRTAATTAPGNLSASRHGAREAHAWPRHGLGPGDGPDALRLKLAGARNPFRRAGAAAAARS